MKIVLASDSYKGSLSSTQVNNIVAQQAQKVFGKCDIKKVQMADGGEGTLAAVLETDKDYRKVEVKVSDPLGNVITASYIMKKDVAVIEMAEASGLTLVPSKLRNPLNTTSKGTGQLIADALKNGAVNIYIGIGGSATNDGGMGAMTMLGYRFLDQNGNELKGTGGDLEKVVAIDDKSVMPELKKAKFTVMCDVTNPLTGEKGATYVFGPQKGADDEIANRLERGMLNYSKVLSKFLGRDISSLPGMGAAGGMGAALYAFTDSKMESGIQVLLDLNDFDNLIKDADMVITGEGRTDEQSVGGKVVSGIAKRCKENKTPLYVLSGSLSGDLEELYDMGVTGMQACVCDVIDISDAMENAQVYLERAAERLFRIIKAG